MMERCFSGYFFQSEGAPVRLIEKIRIVGGVSDSQPIFAHSGFPGHNDGFGATANLQLTEDPVYMIANRFGTDKQGIGNLLIIETPGQ